MLRLPISWDSHTRIFPNLHPCLVLGEEFVLHLRVSPGVDMYKTAVLFFARFDSFHELKRFVG